MAQVLELPARQTRDYLKAANDFYDAGEMDKAYGLVDKELMERPDDPQALVLMSAILKRSNRVSVAYPLALRATQICPERPETWNALAHAAQYLWRMEEAERNYRKALQRAK